MAKLVKSKFLIIEGTGEEFMKAGCGAGELTDHGIVKGGIFDGFSMVSLEPQGIMCCDSCNTGILPSETCYYIAVLNQIFCGSCFKRWHEDAIYYTEDVRYEKIHYNHMVAMLNEAGVAIKEGGDA